MEEKNKKETSNETEEELRKRLKEELKAEILSELEEEKKEKSSKSEEVKKENKEKKNPEKHTSSTASKVHFDSYNDNELKTINAMNRKDRNLQKKDSMKEKTMVEKRTSDSVEEEPVSKGSIVIMLVSLAVIAITIFLFPHAYRYFLSISKKNDVPESSNSNSSSNGPVYEKITVDSKELSTFTYPIMRNSQYEKSSYYEKSSLTMSDFSNNDILYNAFVHVYTGSIAPYEGSYSGNACITNDTKKTINSRYLEARIDNLFSTNTKYEHATFTVPSTNKDTEYVGTWVYNPKTKMYVYYGDCTGVKPTNTLYYDLKYIYEANGTSNNTIIDVTYYMGFAEVNNSNKQYTIYSDALMTDVLTTGTLSTSDYEKELNEIFKNYLGNTHAAKSYKYTFSSRNCSYQDYCFEKGEWVK